MEVNKEMFKTFTTNQKLDYFYDIFEKICSRLEKVEKNKWWTRIFAMIAAGTGGAIVTFLTILK